MIHGKNRAPTPTPGPLCRSFAPLLPVLDDLTDARLADDTREHLAGCAWCRAQRASYGRFDEALRQQFAPEAMPALSPLAIDKTGFAMSETQELHEDGTTLIASDDTAGNGSLPLHAMYPGISNRPPRRSWRMATGAASLAAVLIISLLAGMFFLAHGRSATPTGRRDIATSTVVPGSQMLLTAIGMASPTDGWAVGASTIQNYGEFKTATGVILRYHDGVWSLAQTLPDHSLATISLGTADDGWIGGDAEHSYDGRGGLPGGPSVTAEPALWHYTGSKWVEMTVPKPAESNSMPDGKVAQITMFSATEGWMAVSVPAPQSLHSEVQMGPDIYQLRQGHWVQVQTPTIQQRRTATMNQITFISPDEFWGVGADMWSDSKPTVTPLLAHYHAGTWTVVAK